MPMLLAHLKYSLDPLGHSNHRSWPDCQSAEGLLLCSATLVFLILLITWRCQETMQVSRVGNCQTDNLSTSIDLPRIDRKQGRTRSRQGIKVLHYIVLPKENRAVSIRRAGLPRYLPLIVDAVAVRLDTFGSTC